MFPPELREEKCRPWHCLPVLLLHVQQLLQNLVGEDLLLGYPELLDRLPRWLPEVVRDHGDDHEDVAEAERTLFIA